MSTFITPELLRRCESSCELCAGAAATQAYAVSPRNHDSVENEVALCDTCLELLEHPEAAAHWQCLAGSIWNPAPSVQALSYRTLTRFKEQDWARDILGAVDLEESVIHWALSAFEVREQHLDSNGVVLDQGDTVVLTQALNIKGTSFSAPKGTIVRKIRLVPDHPEQVEGRINGQTIVILTKYLRKSS